MNLYSANIVLDLRSVAIYEGKLYHFLLLDVFSWPVLSFQIRFFLFQNILFQKK